MQLRAKCQSNSIQLADSEYASFWQHGFRPKECIRSLVCTYKSDDGTMWEFTNKEDHWITLIMLPDSAGIDLDTENASIVEHLCIGDCQGLYIERPGDNSLIWGDTSVGGGFALASDNLDKTAIKKIAEKISAK